MALHTTMYILLVILAPVIHSTAETRELVLKESGELCQKSDECSSGRCVPDFSKVKPIKLGFHGVIHHLIIRKCAVCTISSQCQKNQYCSKFKCHNNHKPTTTTAEPTPDEPSLATLLQLLTTVTLNQQKHSKQLIEILLALEFGPDIGTDTNSRVVNVGSTIGTQVSGGANQDSNGGGGEVSNGGAVVNIGTEIGTQNIGSTIGAQQSCTEDATCTVNLVDGK